MRHKTLGVIFLIAVLAAAVGLIYYWKTSTAPVPYSNPTPPASTSTNTQSTNTSTNTAPDNSNPATAGWKTYTNSQYKFSLQYPPYTDAGKTAQNSTLGTFQDPVTGIYVGDYVLVPLTTDKLTQDANDTVNGLLSSVGQADDNADGPSVTCVTENFTNAQAKIKAVSCQGEGGAAFYAIIDGPGTDLFVDGYSKGFDPSVILNPIKDEDTANFFSSFKFSN